MLISAQPQNNIQLQSQHYWLLLELNPRITVLKLLVMVQMMDQLTLQFLEELVLMFILGLKQEMIHIPVLLKIYQTYHLEHTK